VDRDTSSPILRTTPHLSRNKVALEAAEGLAGLRRGIRVLHVANGGPAAQAGVLEGDILVKLAEAAITNADLQGLHAAANARGGTLTGWRAWPSRRTAKGSREHRRTTRCGCGK